MLSSWELATVLLSSWFSATSFGLRHIDLIIPWNIGLKSWEQVVYYTYAINHTILYASQTQSIISATESSVIDIAQPQK